MATDGQSANEISQRYGRDVGLLENAISDLKGILTKEQAQCKHYAAVIDKKDVEIAEACSIAVAPLLIVIRWSCVCVRPIVAWLRFCSVGVLQCCFLPRLMDMLAWVFPCS